MKGFILSEADSISPTSLSVSHVLLINNAKLLVSTGTCKKKEAFLPIFFPPTAFPYIRIINYYYLRQGKSRIWKENWFFPFYFYDLCAA